MNKSNLLKTIVIISITLILAVSLNSLVNLVDYVKLETLLSNKKWEQADQETTITISKLSGRFWYGYSDPK